MGAHQVASRGVALPLKCRLQSQCDSGSMYGADLYFDGWCRVRSSDLSEVVGTVFCGICGKLNYNAYTIIVI